MVQLFVGRGSGGVLLSLLLMFRKNKKKIRDKLSVLFDD
jgi:hypothetical protein